MIGRGRCTGMVDISEVKRAPGRRTEDDEWFIMVEESEEAEGVVLHEVCGRPIVWQKVILLQRDGITPFSGSGEMSDIPVPYCPQCELEPTWGTYGPAGIHIHA
jgi:hypothetical protein